MREKKLNVKRQLFLESIPCTVMFITIIIDNFNLFSNNINKILAIGSWVVIVIAFFISIKEKEAIDESAKSILGKVDGVCLKIVVYILLILMVTTATIKGSSTVLSMKVLESVLGIVAFGILCLRAILFSYYDKKGI